MTHNRLHVFTIFKCVYNVGVTIINYLFDVFNVRYLWRQLWRQIFMCIYQIETILFYEHCKEYRNFMQSSDVEILRKRTVSADPWVIHPKICGNCNLHIGKSEEIPSLCAVAATFAVIWLRFLLRASWNFSKKCVSYFSFKIHNFEIPTATCLYMTLDIYLL